MPADASSPILPAFDPLREHPEAVPEEIPGLLERLAEVPDPRSRSARRTARSDRRARADRVRGSDRSDLPAGGGRVDHRRPPSVLKRLGVRPDPLSPKRCLPAEATVRRLLGRIDGDALDRAVGRRLADRRAGADGQPHAVAVDGKTLRGAARATDRKIHLPGPRIAVSARRTPDARRRRTQDAEYGSGDGRDPRRNQNPCRRAAHTAARRRERGAPDVVAERDVCMCLAEPDLVKHMSPKPRWKTSTRTWKPSAGTTWSDNRSSSSSEAGQVAQLVRQRHELPPTPRHRRFAGRR